jgi:hypothetical protein
MAALWAGLAVAQNPDSAAVRPLVPTRHWVVKFAPLFLLDPEPTVQFGVERVLNARTSVQVEAGYGAFVFNQMYQTSRVRGPFATWRARAEVRHFFERATSRNYRPAPYGSYFAGEIFYKQVVMPLQVDVERLAYIETEAYDAHRQVMGFHFKVGAQERLGNRWVIDGYSGPGFRYVKVVAPDRPAPLPWNDDPWVRETDWWFMDPVEQVLPSFTMNIKIGYVF